MKLWGVGETWGSAIIGVEEGVPQISQGHALLVNLKCKNWSKSAGREKQGHASSLLSRSPKTF